MPVVTTAVGTETGNTPVFALGADQHLLVTESGYVYHMANGYAVEMTGDFSRIINHGTIYAKSVAVRVTGTFTNIINTGTIESQVQYASASGANYFENHGTVTTFGQSFALSGAAASSDTLVNHGTIAGTVNAFDTVRNYAMINGDLIASGSSVLSVSYTNRGTITGHILGSDFTDTFDLIGGTVGGTVDGDFGDDLFRIDASNATGLDRLFGGVGSDTLDLSTSPAAFWIDLMYYGVQAWTSGLGIANGVNATTMIASLSNFENVVGTGGSDTFYGNNVDNRFVWNGSLAGTPDVFFGRGGSDTLDMSAAPSVWVSLNFAGVEVWTSSTVWSRGSNAIQVIVDIDAVENVIGTAGSDEFFGNPSDNLFASRGINYASGVLDYFSAGDGIDTIDLSQMAGFGAVWVDLAYANHQVWQAVGGSHGSSANATTPFADLLSVENIVGTQSSDVIYGNAANNTYFYTLHTNGYYETFDGRNGADTFDASRSSISVYVNLDLVGIQAWTSFGPTSNGANATFQVANLISVENLNGSNFADTLLGSSGANRIFGGLGLDTVTGRGGADTFVARPLMGNDIITDFSVSSGDVIEISGFTGRTTFAEVFANSQQMGAHTQINLGWDADFTVFTALILENFTRTTLSADDFVFV